MVDMTNTIEPKTDRLNADSLIGKPPMTITVTKVALVADDQPVAIHFEGDQDKPYMPSKGMRRVLVQLWGTDAAAYVGRSMTLYRDPNVKFGGETVGGIRISHMSHIDRETTLALTVTRASRKPFTVRPLEAGKQAAKKEPGEAFKALLEKLAKAEPNPGDAARWFNKVLGSNGYEGIGQLLAEPKAKQLQVYREIEAVNWGTE